MNNTVGFIGLGLMGKPMALNLLKAGFSLVVHSRSQAPVDAVVAAGAQKAVSAADVAGRARRIITMLPDSGDVEKVLEGPDGLFSALQPGTIIIDTSSIDPGVARRLAAAADARGAKMLDAPVSGGEIGAIGGTLSIMVGGDPDAFAEVKPILDAMGNPDKVIRIGESGSGQICKVCNQMVLGATIAVVGEAFALATKAGVDPAKVRDALLGGFAASRVLEVHGERILTSNYTPGFRAALFGKDMRIAAATLTEQHVPAPVSSVVQELVGSLLERGRGELDYSALATVLFDLAGVDALR
ncbi:MAG TPA: NAD(P)-binding domain-containing protein [Vicinamibacterales bacterium]|nr:NAD(P)-binding domain-containing protein [Vicinamibacterales bacterium]